MKVYFIATANDIKKDELGWLDWGKSHRVVGFYTDLETAKQAVEKNCCDLYENGYYKYAIIEEREDGLYSYCENPLFYKWEGTIKDGGYKPIDRPEATNGFCGFTI